MIPSAILLLSLNELSMSASHSWGLSITVLLSPFFVLSYSPGVLLWGAKQLLFFSFRPSHPSWSRRPWRQMKIRLILHSRCNRTWPFEHVLLSLHDPPSPVVERGSFEQSVIWSRWDCCGAPNDDRITCRSCLWPRWPSSFDRCAFAIFFIIALMDSNTAVPFLICWSGWLGICSQLSNGGRNDDWWKCLLPGSWKGNVEIIN